MFDFLVAGSFMHTITGVFSTPVLHYSCISGADEYSKYTPFGDFMKPEKRASPIL